MLPRTLEPEVMDDAEEATIYDAMAHDQVNILFVSDYLEFESTLDLAARPATDTDEAAGGTREVLDLGTGTARIPIELCGRTNLLRVVAVDQSLSMLDVARVNVELADLTDRILLDHVDAKATEFTPERFDSVISNSLIHHLPDPEPCLAEAIRITRPGGTLFFRDLARPDTADDVDRLVEQYAGEESQLGRDLFHASLHAALTLAEIQDMVSRLGFAPESVALSSDRHWTWSAVKPSEPPTSPGSSYA